MFEDIRINWSRLFAYIAIFFAFLAFVWFVVAIGVSFSKADDAQRQRAEQWRQDARNPINICIAKGGVPITSSWDGELNACQFPEGTVNK